MLDGQYDLYPVGVLEVPIFNMKIPTSMFIASQINFMNYLICKIQCCNDVSVKMFNFMFKVGIMVPTLVNQEVSNPDVR